MINIFVLVTILGHLPVILSAKSKGSENMEQILIVEDDSFLNKMLDYNLTADGYGVTSALNARTAAEAIRQREFNLVLLDINLPDGNGNFNTKPGKSYRLEYSATFSYSDGRSETITGSTSR